MLVLSRQRDQTIMIGDDIEITVVDIRGDKVRLGINALSAPVFRDATECVGIIGIVGTSAEIPSPPPQTLIRTLHRVAGLLSAELNCRVYFDRGLAGR